MEAILWENEGDGLKLLKVKWRAGKLGT